ncbi:MAG TPA: DNA polymerase III subunit beta [Planctomycetota bacterium]|nr:DNA polymerase III subunit beta [Planctomycetota bacterium]
MKFECNSKQLYSALQLVSTVIPGKSPREILQNVLIDARDGHVQLAGTDLEVGMRYVVPDVQVAKEGVILADAAKLTQILREAGESISKFESGDGLEFKVTYEGAEYDLKGFDPEEYPDVPEFEGDHVEIDGPILAEMISHTAFAAARESMRFAINGVLFTVKEGTAHMVGTDGHRLAWIKRKVQLPEDVGFRGILPLKALDVIGRLVGEAEEPVKLKLEESFIIIKSGNGVITSKLVEGSYPNYEDVVPRDNDKIATVDVALLTSAVRQAAVLTGDESRSVRAQFADDKMVLTARLPERGGAKVVRTIEYSGSPIKIGFNPDFILDMLKVAKGETVRIELKDKDKPALLKAGDDYLYVVMPVSTED